MNAGETLDVTVTVRNKGPRAGKEVIQLYVQSLTSQFIRPNKELKAFAKVALEPGEYKEVHMTLEDRDFQIYDIERQTWRTDGGEYHILIGSSSETIVLRERVRVNEDPRSMAPQFNRMSSLKRFLQYPKTRELITHAFAGISRANVFLGDDEMFTSMPIAKMVVLGALTDEKVDTLIEQANQTLSI
jgi:beta-glucosidase